MTPVLRSLVSSVLASLMLLSPLTPLGTRFLAQRNALSATEVEAERIDVTFDLSGSSDEVELQTSFQRNFLEKFTESQSHKVDAKSERSRPTPAKLRWEVTTEENIDFETYTVTVGRKKDLSDGVSYTVERERYDLYNVRSASVYYWNVSVEYEGQTYTSETASFTTDDTCPHFYRVDGVTNVRDLGGWSTEDGGRVRTELIYRTGCLHTNEEVKIWDSGVDTMKNFLRIKTEIDLRNEIDVTEYGVLGEDVNYIVLPMNFTSEVMEAEKNNIRAFFGVLAERDNYPIIFHCYIGTDRTGVCAFLTLALLGVAKADLYRDYMSSNFGNIGGNRDGQDVDRYVTTLSTFEGDTLAEQTRSYLLSIGVTAEEIDSVISILKETK